eukprot:Sspe_Gene.18126::Locus_6487_Transcript_1_1_Confidence_1.000_Length_1146::g.18126::m.18126
MDNTDSTRFVKPQPPMGEDGGLGPSQVEQWRKEGYCLVQGLLDEELVNDVERTGYDVLGSTKWNDFGSGGRMEFPTDYERVNEMTLSEKLVAQVQKLLGPGQLLLSQSDVWLKIAPDTEVDEYNNSDQRIHMDYPNHTLTHPPKWDQPEAVAIIIYYSDAEQCGGRTAVVPRKGEDDKHYQWPYTCMPGVGAIPWRNNRSAVEEMLRKEHPEVAAFREGLYNAERYVDFKKGTVLFYRHDIWHRGTPVTPGAHRLVHNIVYKKADSPWLNLWSQGVARSMYRANMSVEKLVANATPAQRELLGFPPPGHPYWNEDTIEAVRQRYGPLGMDITPYLLK